MRDRNIATITYLSELLGQAQSDKEAAEDKTEAVRGWGYDLLDEVLRLKQKCQSLEDDLRQAQVQGKPPALTDWRTLNQAEAFQSIMSAPEGFMKAVCFLRFTEGKELQRAGNKIAAIKRVREESGFGLKIAKVLVEHFWSHSPVDPSEF